MFEEYKDFFQDPKQFPWEWAFHRTGGTAVSPIYDLNSIDLRFQAVFPNIDGQWVVYAYVIAPSFGKNDKRPTRGIRLKGYEHNGGYYAHLTPKWYPLPNSGWKSLSASHLGRKSNVGVRAYQRGICLVDPDFDNSALPVSFTGGEDIYSVLGTYKRSYTDIRLNPATHTKEMRDIIRENFDIYLSVALTIVGRHGTGRQTSDTIVATLFGVPQRFVSNEFD